MSADTQELPDDFSFLDLPDDELANYTPPQAGAAPVKAAAQEGEGEAAGSTEGEGAAGVVGPAAEGETSQAAGEAAQEGAAGDDAGAADAKAGGKQEEDPVKPGADAVVEGEQAPAKDEPKVEEPGAVDYKAAYDKLLAPFKANGRDIQVQNVDEAITLMQMGANYNKKMAALKPSLTLLKLLENNGLLSEEKISYLIDLDKKDPAAINKLVHESGLDPMDLDAKKGQEYKAPSRKVDEREVELDAVLDEIQSTPTYQRTIEIVGKTWDVSSRQVVADSPQLLKVINSHVQAGIYDLITAEIERERLFGRMNSVSDIEAYKQVGDAMAARGAFNSLGRQEKPNAGEKVVVEAKPVKADDEALKNKKRAAAPTKPATPAATNQDFNPLAMSDEEFRKVANGKF